MNLIDNNETKRHVITVIISTLLVVPLYVTAPLVLARTPIAPSLGTKQITTIKIVPRITRIQNSPGCLSKGKRYVLLGTAFGSQSGKVVAIAVGRTQLNTTPRSWSNTRITFSVPNTTRLRAGGRYYIGIKKPRSTSWLSNKLSIKICGLRVLQKFPTSATPVRPGRVIVEPIGEESDGGEGDYYPEGDYDDYGSQPKSSKGTGSGLLGSSLPPAPENLPPPKKKTIKRNVVQGEIVVVSSSMKQALALQRKARGLNMKIKRRRVLKSLGLVISVFRVSKDADLGGSLTNFRKKAPKQWMDLNHSFDLMTAGDANKVFANRLINWRSATLRCGNGIRIGLVDTAVDRSHPALRGRKIISRSFLTSGIPRATTKHGTAIAGLLVGHDKSGEFRGLLPGATLYVANVFSAKGGKTSTTAEWVISALDWLAQQRVSVINLSLGGRRNLLVEAAIKRLQQRNILVVAAAGNNGPKALPIYPAAQRNVVAVSAIDANSRPYRKANRGRYISYVAPGVDVWVAQPGGKGTYASGTSYATPFVTATFALARRYNPKAHWVVLHKRLAAKTRDLGQSGRDPVFGWGLIQSPGACR